MNFAISSAHSCLPVNRAHSSAHSCRPLSRSFGLAPIKRKKKKLTTWISIFTFSFLTCSYQLSVVWVKEQTTFYNHPQGQIFLSSLSNIFRISISRYVHLITIFESVIYIDLGGGGWGGGEGWCSYLRKEAALHTRSCLGGPLSSAPWNPLCSCDRP